MTERKEHAGSNQGQTCAKHSPCLAAASPEAPASAAIDLTRSRPDPLNSTYVQALENVLGLSISNIEGLEDKILQLLDGSKYERGASFRLSDNTQCPHTLRKSWESSELFQHLRSGRLTEPGMRRSSTMGEPTSPPTTVQSRKPRESDTPDPECAPSPKRVKFGHEGPDPHSNPALELPSQAPHLLDMYFAHSHCWLPILEKHKVLRVSYSYSGHPVRITRSCTGSGGHAALWAILSYTTAQLQSTNKIGLTNPIAKAKEFYSISKDLIPAETGTFEVGHVQALLLLTLVKIGFGEWTAAWLLSGQAVRLAVALGFGSRPNNASSPEGCQAQGAFLACFLFDTLLSVRLGRRPYLHEDDLLDVGLLEEDGLDEWGSWVQVFSANGMDQGGNGPARGPIRARSCFNRLVELVQILNKAVQRNPIQPGRAALFQDILINLQSWESKIPDSCRLARDASQIPMNRSAYLPHQTYLLLSHMATLSVIYMRFPSESRSIQGPLRKILPLTLQCLTSHARNFDQTILPPIFEFALRSIVQGAEFAKRSATNDQQQPANATLLDLVAREANRAGAVWPVFRTLVKGLGGNQSHSQPHGVGSPSDAQKQGGAPDPTFCQESRSLSLAELDFLLGSGGDNPKAPDEPISFVQTRRWSDRPTAAYHDIDYGSLLLSPQQSIANEPDLSVRETPITSPISPCRRRTRTPTLEPSFNRNKNTPSCQTTTPGSSVSDVPAKRRFSCAKARMPDDLDSLFDLTPPNEPEHFSSYRQERASSIFSSERNSCVTIPQAADDVDNSKPFPQPIDITDIWPPPGYFPDLFEKESEGKTGLAAREPNEHEKPGDEGTDTVQLPI